MDARLIERREFLGRLRTDALFLARHTPALSAAVYRKLRNRMRISLNEVHRGRKIWPEWLQARELTRGRASSDDVRDELRLPQYALAVGELSEPIASMGEEDGAPQPEDPERYFAKNRWGFLLQAMFEGRPDWDLALKRCQHWIEGHTNTGDSAWEPYSSCERIANLLIFLAAMPPGLRSAAAFASLRSFLETSMQWVYGHLEYYGAEETNNHILNNARALAMCGSALSCSEAVAAAVQILRRCLPELITEAGFLRERSSHYQLIVLNWLLDAWTFLASYAGADSIEASFVRVYIDRMIAAAAMLCDQDARLVGLIGDVSPDATPEQSLARLRLLYGELWPCQSHTATACEAKDDWFRLSAGKGLVLGCLPTGRYPARYPTHGHCDATSFVWRDGDQDILVDPGRYRYTLDRISQYQRSAFAHNLPMVNGFGPLCESVMRRSNWCPMPYAGAQLELQRTGAGILMRHDGFARCTPVKSHQRLISLSENGLRVEDSFEGQGSIWLEFCWHFSEHFHTFDAVGLRAVGIDRTVEIRLHGVPAVEVLQPKHGSDRAGWISRAYGKRTPSLAVRMGQRVALPITITTQFE